MYNYYTLLLAKEARWPTYKDYSTVINCQGRTIQEVFDLMNVGIYTFDVQKHG